MTPRPYRFGPTLPLLLLPISTLTAMTAFQWMKHFFWPNLSIGTSHLQTNLFVTIIVTAAGFLLCRYFEARSLLASIVQSSDDAIIGTTLDGSVFSWNRGAERIYGFSSGEMIGKPLAVLLPPDRPEDIDRLLERIGKGEQVDHYETVRVRKDGKHIYVSLSVSPILNSTGKVIGASSIIREITDRKEAERALRESEASLARTQAFSLVMVAHIGLDGRWLKAPSGLCEVLGYSEEELLKQKSQDLTHPADLNEELKQCRRLIDGEVKSVDLEKRCITRGRKIIWLYLNYTLVSGADGRPRYFLVYLRDVTKRKSAEREVERYQSQLEELVESRTLALTRANKQLQTEIAERMRAEQSLRESSDKLKLFAYSVIHDLKSPSIGIYGLTKRLSESYEEVLDTKGRLYCEQILKASEHVARLIDEINAYIAAKEAPLAFESVDLKEIFRTVRNEFSERLGERRIKWTEPESAPGIVADRMSLLRVFRNFVDNALKYGGEELGAIRVGYSETADFHVLSVCDDGTALEDEDRRRIFDVFERTAASKGVSGTGLGLAIVKEIAERHNGSVWVAPDPKKGKTFRISVSKSLGMSCPTGD